MQRLKHEPRPYWKSKMASILPYHSEGGRYWNEGTHYVLTAKEASVLQCAAQNCQSLLAYTVHCVLYRPDLRAELLELLRQEWHDVPAELVAEFLELLAADWREWQSTGTGRVRIHPLPVSPYGRMDFMFNEQGCPVLLEYNADTPVTALEAGPATEAWWQEVRDQPAMAGLQVLPFNQDKLARAFNRYAQRGYRKTVFTTGRSETGGLEYQTTAAFLAEVAGRGGLQVAFRFIEDLTVEDDGRLTAPGFDLDSVFKIYPTESLFKDAVQMGVSPNGLHAVFRDQQQFINHPSAILLSGKWLMAFAWRLVPLACAAVGLPPTFLSREQWQAWADQQPTPPTRVVAKTFYGRVGTEVEVLDPAQPTSLKGPVVYQKYEECQKHDGYKHTIGVWLLDNEFGGLVLREQLGDVTGDDCLCTPITAKNWRSV
jgi:glutathionylspermidine synthase